MSQTARIQTRDLGQQLEAADKQLKATRQFLEEQAQEREAEREEWERRVLALQQQPARSGHLKRDSNLLINSYFRNILTSLRAEVLYNGMHACKDHLQSHAPKCFSDYLIEKYSILQFILFILDHLFNPYRESLRLLIQKEAILNWKINYIREKSVI